jgi:hypothetical protein
MPNPFEEKFTQQNPIVEAATRIRARREIARAADGIDEGPVPFEDAEQALDAFGDRLAAGAKRLNAILGRSGMKFVKILHPLRLRLRFAEKRVSLDLDEVHQLVRVSGLGLEGEWQFDPGAHTPSLINLSKISTEAGYGEALTASSLLQLIAADEALEPPPHLQGPGPLSF